MEGENVLLSWRTGAAKKNTVGFLFIQRVVQGVPMQYTRALAQYR